jgi:hypothetical protein
MKDSLTETTRNQVRQYHRTHNDNTSTGTTNYQAAVPQNQTTQLDQHKGSTNQQHKLIIILGINHDNRSSKQTRPVQA